MGNTITQRTLKGAGSDRKIVRLIDIVSDGSQETATVIFQNSSFKNDATKGKLRRVYISGDSCSIQLLWDQTTDSPILAANPVNSPIFDYDWFGGINNPNGSGATGNLLLTTIGLANTNRVTILFEIDQD